MFMADIVSGIAGLGLILAPFLFGFYGNLIATWASVAIGMMFFVNACVKGVRRYDYDDEVEIDGDDQQE